MIEAAPQWIRLFYRNGKNEAFLPGKALDRALARKVPAVIHQELALIHKCQQCGIEGPWTDKWLAYPVLIHHPPHIQAKVAPAEWYKACSRACFGELIEKSFEPSKWMNPHREPDRDKDRVHALWDAERDEQDRKRETVAHRKVPLPEWRGKGFCKWCNEKMTAADKPSWMWHKRCARQFMLHSDLWTQTRYLRERDGRECAKPGCSRHGSEVDHRRPLWSIRHLPPMMRRPFYGPVNLWLLCNQCHLEKSAIEAAQRAARRRKSAGAG